MTRRNRKIKLFKDFYYIAYLYFDYSINDFFSRFYPGSDAYGFAGFSTYIGGANTSSPFAAYTFDNVSVKKLTAAPGATAITAVKNSADAPYIYADSDALKVTFDAAMDSATLTSANVSVTSGGNNVGVSGVTYDSATNTATIALTSALTMCSDVVVTFSTNVACGGAAFSRPYQIIGNTDVMSYTTYGQLDVSSDAGTYTATIPVYYTPDTGKDVMLVVAGYNGNVLADIALKTVTLAHGENILSVSKAGLQGNVKAFLWDGAALSPIASNSGIQ